MNIASIGKYLLGELKRTDRILMKASEDAAFVFKTYTSDEATVFSDHS
jgi:hypothetical protein